MTNPLVSMVLALTLATNLSYTVFSTTSLSTTLFSLLKSARAAFSLSISVLSSSASFRLAKSDFAAKLDVLTPVAFLNLLLLRN